MTKLIPLNGFIILKPIETMEETYGNIVLPDLGKERPEIGIVVATSNTYNYHLGQNIQSSLNTGDKVLIPKMGSQKIVIDGEDYYITKETDIFSIIQED